METIRKHRHQLLVFLFLCFVTAVTARYSPLNPLHSTGLTADQGVFYTLAKGILNGKVPYVDYFDHKGPLLYLYLALGLKLGRGLTGCFLLELPVIFLSVWLVWRIARMYAEPFYAAVATGAVFLINVREFTTSNSEEFLFPLLLLAILLFLGQMRDGVENGRAFWMGFAGMAVFFIKFNYCIIWAVLGIAMFLVMVFDRAGVRRIVRMCLSFALGMAAASVLPAAYLFATKSVGAFIETYVLFSIRYAGFNTLAKRFESARTLLSVPPLPVLVLFCAGVVLAVLFRVLKKKEPEKRLKEYLWWLLITAAVVVATASPGQPWSYYQQMTLCIYIVPLCAFAQVLERICGRLSFHRAFAAVIFCLVLCVLYHAQLSPDNLRLHTDENRGSLQAVTAEINRQAVAGDRVLAFACDCGVYFYTDCEAASRIIFPSACIIDPSLQDELFADVEADPPRFITYTSGWTFGIPERMLSWSENLLSDYDRIYDDGIRTLYMKKAELGAPETPAVSVLGDSISTFAGFNPPGYLVYYDAEMRRANALNDPADTWWGRLILSEDAHLLANSSFGNTWVTGDGFPSISCMERINALGKDRETPEQILVYAGINDFGIQIAIADENGNTDGTTYFEGAYRTMIERLQETYPEAEIWCATLLKSCVRGDDDWRFEDAFSDRSIHLEEYNDAIRRACADTGVHLVDLAASGVRYESLDGIHPTREGQKTIAETWMDAR